MKIYIVINDGFEDIETLISYDYLKRLNQDVLLVSRSNYVKSSHNLIIKSDLIIDEYNYKDADYVILPGGSQYAFNLNDKLYHEIIKPERCDTPLRLFHDKEEKRKCFRYL